MFAVRVNNFVFNVKSLLGKGKGGYSYLVKKSDEEKYYVVKQIHHEPCDYYSFGNKIEAEYNDYHRLLNAKIRVPKMLDIDFKRESILKEYIEGETIFDLIKDGISVEKYLPQVREMAEQAKNNGINIDYFPTNFVVNKDDLLYYVDYECNNYMEEWNFENWGIKYWSKTPEFLECMKKVNEK
ncbi:serine/threonine protein kinase, partial [bacterium]|nr:serine/threonine protein kinase [bacterium]